MFSSKTAAAAAFLSAAACIGVGAYFAVENYNAYCMRSGLLERTRALQETAAKIRADNEFKKEYFNRVLSDGEFAARVARETLGYVGENEIIFKFDAPSFSARGGGVSVEKKSGK